MVFSLFRRKNGPAKEQKAVPRFDAEQLTPVIRCSICTGEQVAGFRRKGSGTFEEVMLLKTPENLETFRSMYGIEGEIEKIY